MNEPDLVLHFGTREVASTFAKANGARVSRALSSTPLYAVRLRPATFQARLRMRLAAMDAGAVPDPLAKHQEWRCHG